MNMDDKTENDTFLALKRPSVSEMYNIHYRDWVANANGLFEGVDEMCERHGWTWTAFNEAWWQEK